MLGDLAAMEVGSKSTEPRTVEEIFKDFKERRIGILKALTSDVEDFFFPQCDPEKENLCLYGSDASWEVSLPSQEFPPELPEPARGINFSRDRMPREDWLSLIAVHSDAWLVAVAYFYGSRLDNDDRKQLLLLINELPTVFEVVTGKEPVEKFQQSAHPRKRKRKPFPVPKEEKQSDTFCGLCGGKYTADEFWRNCDSCEKWYHGKCVEITPAMNEYIKHYKCPSCCL